MTGYWPTLFIIGFGIAVIVYACALKLHIMALVDLIWTIGLGFGAIAYALYNNLSDTRAWLVLLVSLLWSMRLSYYLLKDRILSGREDPRYLNLATYWGKNARRNFLGLFLIQIPFVALFLIPITTAMQNPATMHWLDIVAVGIAIVALAGEGLADRQLALFRADPDNKNKVLNDGLWRYTRHPNYFFEWLHWWAYAVFSVGSPNWWLSLTGPAAMYIFLRYLTGIPHAERSSLQRRGEAYRKYQYSTSPFFPWIPRHPQA